MPKNELMAKLRVDWGNLRELRYPGPKIWKP